MDELSPRARALLDAARSSDDPAPSDAVRIRQSVLVRVGAANFGAALFMLSLDHAKALIGSMLPKFITVALLAVSGSALYQHWKASSAVPATLPPPAASAPAAVEAPIAPAPPPAVTSAPAPAAAPPKPVSFAKESLRDNLEAEMRWVRAADAALRGGDVGLALKLLNRHAHEFPNGLFAEEREGLRVVAACQAGASPVVQRAASRFLQHAPRSLMAGRVRAACPDLPQSGS